MFVQPEPLLPRVRKAETRLASTQLLQISLLAAGLLFRRRCAVSSFAVILFIACFTSKNKVQKFQVRQSFVIYNCQCAAWIKINNSHEEHGHARLQMSSITRLGLIAN